LTGKDQRSAFQRIFGAVKVQGGADSRFRGIGVVLFVVGVTALAAALSAPRATAPEILPLPVPDRAVLRRVKERCGEQAQRAREHGLSYDVRAVGEAIRRAGAKTVEGKGAVDPVLGEVRLAVHLAREKKSDQGLLELLCLQTELFVEATHAYEASGKPSSDLTELGGDFLVNGRKNGWLDGREVALDDAERAALFHLRWAELTGLRGEALFSPVLDEYRAYYAAYLRGLSAPEEVGRAMSVVRALEKRDSAYPAAFARGVLFYRAGLYGDAAAAFSAHLAAHPDGPWTLRAKNHVLGALARESGGD
jgi:hypothetical protein